MIKVRIIIHTRSFPGDLFIVTSGELIAIKSFSFVHTQGNVWKEPIRFSALLKIIIPIGVTQSFREKAFPPPPSLTIAVNHL